MSRNSNIIILLPKCIIVEFCRLARWAAQHRSKVSCKIITCIGHISMDSVQLNCCTTQESSQLQEYHVYWSYLRQWTVSYLIRAQHRSKVSCRNIIYIVHTSENGVCPTSWVYNTGVRSAAWTSCVLVTSQTIDSVQLNKCTIQE